MDFYALLGAVLGGVKRDTIGKVFWQKLGSDLVVQSSRQGYPVQNFPLYHLGMVPGGEVFMGARQGRIFVFFWAVLGGSKVTKLEKSFCKN